MVHMGHGWAVQGPFWMSEKDGFLQNWACKARTGADIFGFRKTPHWQGFQGLKSWTQNLRAFGVREKSDFDTTDVQR